MPEKDLTQRDVNLSMSAQAIYKSLVRIRSYFLRGISKTTARGILPAALFQHQFTVNSCKSIFLIKLCKKNLGIQS